jgi:hypothetical protein
MIVATCKSGFPRILVVVHCLTMLSVGVQLAGCAAESAAVPAVEIGAADRLRWLRPNDVERYHCEIGTLVCEAGTGRTSARFCRCVD